MKKIVSMFLFVALFAACSSGKNVNASAYPVFYPEEYNLTSYVGDKIYLDYTIFPEYENEKISIKIYNSNGKLVASGKEDFYNFGGYVRNYSIKWNTKGEKTGKYKVVAKMEFYTFSDWHSCPRKKVSYIKLKNKPKNGVSIKRVKNVKGYRIKATWKKVKNAKKYQVKIGRKVYNSKKNSFVSKALKKEKWFSVKIRAYVSGKWGPWSPKKRAYTMD